MSPDDLAWTSCLRHEKWKKVEERHTKSVRRAMVVREGRHGGGSAFDGAKDATTQTAAAATTTTAKMFFGERKHAWSPIGTCNIGPHCCQPRRVCTVFRIICIIIYHYCSQTTSIYLPLWIIIAELSLGRTEQPAWRYNKWASICGHRRRVAEYGRCSTAQTTPHHFGELSPILQWTAMSSADAAAHGQNATANIIDVFFLFSITLSSACLGAVSDDWWCLSQYRDLLGRFRSDRPRYPTAEDRQRTRDDSERPWYRWYLDRFGTTAMSV